MEYRAKEVGARLKSMRKSMGYSREKIAESIGRTPKYYSDIERGTCGMSIETLLSLADEYHVSLDYLVYGDESEATDLQKEQIRYVVQQFSNMGEEKRKTMIDMLMLLDQ